MSEKSIRSCIKRWHKDSTVEPKKSTGRPAAITPRIKNKMLNFIKTSKKDLNYGILKSKFKLSCNKRTLNKWGLENGFRKIKLKTSS